MRQRLQQRFVALLPQTGEQRNGLVGHFDDVVDQVHVGVSRRRIGSEFLLLKIGQAVVIGVQDHVAGVASV